MSHRLTLDGVGADAHNGRMIDSHPARNALDAIAAPDTPRGDACRDAIRSLLICDDAHCRDELVDDLDMTRATVDAIATLIDAVRTDADAMTALLLDYSLCPIHAIDYAICFDDDPDDCRIVRTIHPGHDT